MEIKDRCARADSIGVPIDVAAYRDHRLKADATEHGLEALEARGTAEGPESGLIERCVEP
jgi:hypothetical protein